MPTETWHSKDVPGKASRQKEAGIEELQCRKEI